MRAKQNDNPGEAMDDLKEDLKDFAKADIAMLARQMEAVQKDMAALAAAIGNAGKGQAEAMSETVRGAFDQATSGLRTSAAEARQRGEAAAEEIEAVISRNPLTSLLVAMGVGFLVGMIARR